MSSESSSAPTKAKFSDYVELTKPRLSLLSVLTAIVGYYASKPERDLVTLIYVFVGTSLAAGGVAVLNQWLEFDTDAQMHRTANRPIPSGKIPTGSAFILGATMCLISCMGLFALVGKLAALFTALTIVTYLGWYTPAKRYSRWSTEIGAIAGAFPPLIGWAAGEGRISALGWILFLFMYFWQMPHFMAVAWIYRKDYSAVHFPMPTVTDESGKWAAGWSFVNTLLLLIVSVLPYSLHLVSIYYTVIVALLGIWFLYCAILFLKASTRDQAARKLFLASIAYLPLALGALVLDRLFIHV